MSGSTTSLLAIIRTLIGSRGRTWEGAASFPILVPFGFPVTCTVDTPMERSLEFHVTTGWDAEAWSPAGSGEGGEGSRLQSLTPSLGLTASGTACLELGLCFLIFGCSRLSAVGSSFCLAWKDSGFNLCFLGAGQSLWLSLL